jgi:hypothetical protein
MPSNSPLDELLIDVFDDKIAFGYAYWYQQMKNDDLARLADIANEAQHEAEHDAEMLSIPGASKRSVRYSVVNDLQGGLGGKPRKARAEKSTGAWQNGPGKDLESIAHDKRRAHLILWDTLSSRIETGLPRSVKAHITKEQVSAFAKEVLTELTPAVQTPIHIPSLTIAMHSLIIERNSVTPSESESDGRSAASFDRYLNLTQRAISDDIASRFHDRMFAKFETRAKQLDIPIGRHYPWGALIDRPPSVTTTLFELACLIHQGAVSYRHWKINKDLSELLAPIPPENYIKLSKEPSVRFRSLSGPAFFSGDTSTFAVDGVPLQNQLAMILPYDRPVAELDQLLDRFKKHFLLKGAAHRANLGHPGSKEEEKNARIAALLPEPNISRIILNRSTSIPMHLIAIRSFEPDRPHEEGKLKSLGINILEQFGQFGFALTKTTVDNALKNAVIWQKEVIKKLDQL